MLQVHGIARLYQKADLNPKDDCYNDLVDECRRLPPGSKLSYNLRNRLEKFTLEERKQIVSRLCNGCAPLFIACKRGQVEIVEYLLDHCGGDMEQCGIYEVPDDRSVHSVTSLWCAAVSGKLSVIKLLIGRGAKINAVSDTGSTPVRSACFMTHLDVVKYLVEHGADINKANYNGGTCLINSVQSVELCEFLIKNKADINARDIQKKTALHYSIQEHRLETTRLLVENGADCFCKSKFGDDALQTACLKGAVNIFNYLITRFEYPPDKLADAHELMGSTFLEEHNDMPIAMSHWTTAIAIRERHGHPEGYINKLPHVEPKEAFRFLREYRTLADLDTLFYDIDGIRIQSLLVAERVLGSHHKDTVFRLMFRGASYADMRLFQRCIDLWRRALEIRVEKDSILYSDTTFTAQAIVRFMVDYNEKITEPEDTDPIILAQRFRDAYVSFQILCADIEVSRKLLEIHPQYKRQMENYDKILKCLIHLVYLMLQTAATDEERHRCKIEVLKLVKLNPKCMFTGDSLLHLCVSKMNTIRSQFFVDDEAIAINPQYQVVKYLLECGADVNSRNFQKETALHIACYLCNCNDWLVPLLLKHGAHIDVPNNKGETVIKKVNSTPLNLGIQTMKHTSLACLAASVCGKFKIPYKGKIPRTLEHFIQMHSS